MNIISLILLVAAFVLFAIAAFVPAHPRVNLIALGLACLVLGAWIIPQVTA